jgi:hypothetical protein
MARLNLTLDDDTWNALVRHAESRPIATVARDILRAELARRDALGRRRALAKDYIAGRADERALLAELEGGQLALLEDDDDAA